MNFLIFDELNNFQMLIFNFAMHSPFKQSLPITSPEFFVDKDLNKSVSISKEAVSVSKLTKTGECPAEDGDRQASGDLWYGDLAQKSLLSSSLKGLKSTPGQRGTNRQEMHGTIL